ncbi:MAG: YitT family protein [Rikenellaceae bacterium]
MNLDKKLIFNEVKSYLLISLGLFMYSFAWTVILTPAKVMGGGIPGVSMLIFEATGGSSPTGELIGIPMGYSYFAINVVLIILGFILIGPKFGAKTIFAMGLNSLLLTVLQFFFSTRPDVLGLGSDKLLSAILGGALGGFGIGICFGQGGSTGGTDIIAMILNKYQNISLGKTIIACDMIIVASSYFVTGDITSIIYGFITMSVVGYGIDLYLQGNKQTCQLFIISKKYADIADRIVSDARRGATILNGEGWFTKQPQKIIMVTCRKNETSTIYRIVKEVDNNAFVTNASVSGVYGNGFDLLKHKK